MKKLSILLFVVFIFISILYAEGADVKYSSAENSACPWMLLGTDAVLTGLAVWAIMGQVQAATDYGTLQGEIDDTTAENYYRLLYEKEKVDRRGDLALIAGSAAGAALLYTAIDYFFLHKVFSVEVKTGYDYMNSEMKLSLIKEF